VAAAAAAGFPGEDGGGAPAAAAVLEEAAAALALLGAADEGAGPGLARLRVDVTAEEEEAADADGEPGPLSAPGRVASGPGRSLSPVRGLGGSFVNRTPSDGSARRRAQRMNWD
jgi:hypothetical protein